MQFTETSLPGVWIITPDPIVDERGHFARTYCEREFAARGLCTTWVQMSTSYNSKKGTLRGLHFQQPPHDEAKVVRCVRGAIFDVVLDLRQDSAAKPTWQSFELNDVRNQLLYIPSGFAHGFQTLADHTEVHYMISAHHHAESVAGIRWNDSTLAIPWPLEISAISERDRLLSNYSHVTASRS